MTCICYLPAPFEGGLLHILSTLTLLSRILLLSLQLVGFSNPIRQKLPVRQCKNSSCWQLLKIDFSLEIRLPPRKSRYPVNTYLLKVNDRNTGKKYNMYSKFTIKTATWLTLSIFNTFLIFDTYWWCDHCKITQNNVVPVSKGCDHQSWEEGSHWEVESIEACLVCTATIIIITSHDFEKKVNSMSVRDGY